MANKQYRPLGEAREAPALGLAPIRGARIYAGKNGKLVKLLPPNVKM